MYAPLQFKDLMHVESNYSRRQHRYQHPYAQSRGRGRAERNQQRKVVDDLSLHMNRMSHEMF